MRPGFHLLNRVLALIFEVVGVLAVIAFLLWCGLIWRLSQGPLNVDFLTRRFEKSFNERHPGFAYDIGTTELAWGGHFEPFIVEMRDVKVARADGTPVLSVRRVGVLLSKRNLVIGRIVPKEVEIYGPAFRVIRWEDGRFTLNLGAPPEPVYGPPPPAAEGSDVSRQAGLIKDILSGMRDGGGWTSVLGGLRRIEMSGASAFYEDRVLGVTWRSLNANVAIDRSDDGIVSNARLVLEMGGGQQSIVKTSLYYPWDTQRTDVTVLFRDFMPSRAAQNSEALQKIAGIDLPLKGSLNLTLDPDFRPAKARFALASDAGSFSGFGLYSKPMPLRGFYAAGRYDVMAGTGGLDSLKLDLGDAKLEATGKLATESGITTASLDAVLADMPIDDLATFWPESLARDARTWVTRHLSKGIATKATLGLELAYDPAAEKKVSLKKVGGKIDFNGIRVNYFPPLMPVMDARGRATYDDTSFNLDISGGSLGDMSVKKSAIHITGLDKQSHDIHSQIDIAVSLKGPLKTALQVLDKPPLKYPEMLGIRSSDVGGNAEVDVSFKFPLHKNLALEEVHVGAQAKLTDVMLKDMVLGLPVSGGPMDLTVDSGSLRVKGSGNLATMPVSFDWTRSFAKGSDVAGKVTAELPLDAAVLRAAGLPESLNISGAVPAKLTYTQKHDDTSQLELKGDLSALAFSVSALGFQKNAGTSGAVALDLRLRGKNPERLTSLDLKTEGAALRGSLDFGKDTAGGTVVKKARISSVVLGETDVAVDAAYLGTEGYDVKINGKTLDVSGIVGGDSSSNSDAEAAKKTTPVRLTLNVGQLLTAKDRGLSGVKAFLRRNAWQRIEQLELDGAAGGKAVYLRYLPQPGGQHSLRFEADNAGAALSALGITRSVRGGKLVVDGKPRPKSGPRDLSGMALLTNFSLKDAPVVAKLLNAMSLAGIQALLTGEGISFKKARVDFAWTDRGAPADAENVRMIRLKDGQTSGASLGLTFEGNIDNWKNVYDLNGTIVPVSDLNKLLAAIPLVGDILTAGGEGFIAATYKIKGPKDNPTVTINPLAALAPGVLRKIFFEN